MNRRLSNRQSLICAAFGVLSMLFVIQANAENQCSRVFQIEKSVITADIAELAKMKLEIDLGKMQGLGDSFFIKSLEQAFPDKWKIVVEKNHLSEAHLKKLIASEIARLQNLKSDEQLITTSKKSMQTLLRSQIAPVYEMKTTMSLNKFMSAELQGIGLNEILGYSQNKKKILLGSSGKGLGRILDLDSGNVTTLGGSFSELRVSSDGKSLLTLTENREFISRNMKNFAVDRTVALDKSKFPRDEVGFHQIDLSPDGKTLAVGDQDGKVMLFSIATGQMIASVKNDWISADKITAVRFVDNNRIVFDSGRALFRYDMTTKAREVLPFQQDGVMSMGISMDKSLVTLVQMRNAIAVDLNKFQIAHIEEVFFTNTNRQVFKEVPGDTMGHFVLIDRSGGKSPAIYDPNHMTETLFSFDDRYEPDTKRVVLDMLFSPDKDEVHVLFKEGDEYKIDEWSLLQ